MHISTVEPIMFLMPKNSWVQSANTQKKSPLGILKAAMQMQPLIKIIIKYK